MNYRSVNVWVSPSGGVLVADHNATIDAAGQWQLGSTIVTNRDHASIERWYLLQFDVAGQVALNAERLADISERVTRLSNRSVRDRAAALIASIADWIRP